MAPPLRNTTLCVKRGGASALSDAVVVQSQLDVAQLKENQVILQVDKFGFSANNVTYGLLGEHPHFRYFDFFPAPKTSLTSPKTHAVLPVWGYGTVIASSHPSLHVGQRVSGYLSMSSYCLLQLDPPRARPSGKSSIEYTVNVALNGMPEDRRPYRQLTFCETDFMWTPEREDEMMLYLPLFWTSYWMEDSLNQKAYRDARTIVISSASSKTAFLVTYRIQKRREAAFASGKTFRPIKVVGLTSRSNLSFTRKLGFYDQVFAYDEVANITKVSRDIRECLYIDVSGNESLNANVAKHLSPKLTVSLGITSVEGGNASSITGAQGNKADWESFFMPEWLELRVKELGPKKIKEMQKTAWGDLMEDCPSWVGIKTYEGNDDVLGAYQRTVKGGIPPNEGQMFSLSRWVDTLGGALPKARL
ncbi:hypothetical protein DL93DRAFT_2053669 [Clavulina sp. PMI_390]|nr:hypothetical protein DL93DRAFT_2053669 [Clavulina sp. PMI_390]